MAKKVSEVDVAFRNELVKIWGNDTRMIDYASKAHTPYKMSNGYLFLVDRPNIRTSFCFGYHTDYSGHECSDAENLREHCSKSENYFRTENMRGLKQDYYTFKSDEKLYWVKNYDRSDNIMMVITQRAKDGCYFNSNNIMGEVSNEDRKLLVSAMENEIAKFDKRLNAYIKRFGLSKIKSWTYWLDE